MRAMKPAASLVGILAAMAAIGVNAQDAPIEFRVVAAKGDPSGRGFPWNAVTP